VGARSCWFGAWVAVSPRASFALHMLSCGPVEQQVRFGPSPLDVFRQLPSVRHRAWWTDAGGSGGGFGGAGEVSAEVAAADVPWAEKLLAPILDRLPAVRAEVMALALRPAHARGSVGGGGGGRSSVKTGTAVAEAVAEAEAEAEAEALWIPVAQGGRFSAHEQGQGTVAVDITDFGGGGGGGGGGGDDFWAVKGAYDALPLMTHGNWSAKACAHLPATCAAFGYAPSRHPPPSPPALEAPEAGGVAVLPRRAPLVQQAQQAAPGATPAPHDAVTAAIEEFIAHDRRLELWETALMGMGFHRPPPLGITIHRGERVGPRGTHMRACICPVLQKHSPTLQKTTHPATFCLSLLFSLLRQCGPGRWCGRASAPLAASPPSSASPPPPERPSASAARPAAPFPWHPLRSSTTAFSTASPTRPQ